MSTGSHSHYRNAIAQSSTTCSTDKSSPFYSQTRGQFETSNIIHKLQTSIPLTSSKKEPFNFQGRIYDVINGAYNSFQINPFNNSHGNSAQCSLNRLPNAYNSPSQGSTLIQCNKRSLKDFVALEKARYKAANSQFKQHYDPRDPLIEIGKLGYGAYGEVCLMLDKQSRQLFAHKKQRSGAYSFDDNAARQEYLALEKIRTHDNPRLLKIYDIVYSLNTKFSVSMEYGQGTLYDFIKYASKKKYKWTPQDYIGIYAQIDAQLTELRELKLCHRDVKPENIIISADGSLKLTDFGLAVFIWRTGIQEMSVSGTQKYWAPELEEAHSQGKKTCLIDPFEADLFSLRKLINDLMQSNGEKTTIETLLEEKPRPMNSCIPIYEDHKKEYRIQVFDNLCNVPSLKQKYNLLKLFIDWYIFEEISEWICSNLETYKKKEEIYRFYFLVGDLLQKQGDYNRAIQHYEISEKTAPRLDDKQAVWLYSAMGSAEARRITDNAEDRELALKAAENYHRKSIEIMKRHYGERSAKVAREHSRLGDVERFRGRRKEALEFHKQALDIFEAGLNTDEEIKNEILNGIAIEEEALGKYDEAKEILLKNIEYFEETKGKRHPDVARVKNRLGMVYNHLYQTDKALECLQDSLETSQQISDFNKLVKANIYLNHGVSYHLQEKWEQALNFYRQSEAILAEISKCSPHHLLVTSYIEEVSVRMGDYRTAQDRFSSILEDFRKTSPDSHLLIGAVLYSFGVFYKKIGHYQEAFEKFEKSIECFKKVDAGHPKIGISKAEIGELHIISGQFRESTLKLLKNSLQLLEEGFPHDHGEIARCLCNIAETNLGLKRYEKARSYLIESTKIATKLMNSDHSLIQRMAQLNRLLYACSEGQKNEVNYVRCNRRSRV